MIGTTLHSRYRIDSELGRGGMGVVYRAHDTLLERPVAVKLVSDDRLGAEGRARLLREARAAAQLNHPNIVGIYDAGEAGPADDPGGQPFIVMELVEGRSLYEQAPLPLETVIGLGLQICKALEHAHTHGVVHRDLKPENVVVTPNGAVKVLDFGLARAAATRSTGQGRWAGTVFYLAPEVVQGQAFDGRADLYSLGVMLYELATGRLPFDGDDPLAVISQHLHTAPAPPRRHAPDLPEAVEAVILKLLAKPPAERFATGGEAAHALAHSLDGTGHAPPRSSATRHNLPIQITSFVGRERELAAVRRLLGPPAGLNGGGEGVRLLTITGSGGTGKTRLALRAAEEVLHEFGDGVWQIELASLSNPAQVAQRAAKVLGVREETGYPVMQALIDFVRHRSLLLILDNSEHLIEACAQLAEAVLQHCPRARVVVTSREALGITGETIYRLPSLSAPDPHQPTSSAELLRYEAAQLFVERARAARPDFQVTEANVASIAQICHRLDGVALAIELAAARLRALTVEQIAARLDDRFRLLTGGSRTALPRQQTLRALIDWSYDLLTEPERAVLRRLAVFVQGWTLEGAEAVACDADAAGLAPADVLELLTHLVDKSLVQLEEPGGTARYQMLETIRQYALEKLVDSGEVKAVRDRHRAFYQRLAEAAEPQLRGAAQLVWLARLAAEHDNLRAALQWALGHAAADTAQRFAGSLARYWYLRGYWQEGRDWLAQALALRHAEPEAEAAGRARLPALLGAAWLMDENGDEVPLYQESLAIARRVGDRWSEALALRGLGAREANWGDAERAVAMLKDSLALFRALDDAWGQGIALFNLGWATYGGDAAETLNHWDESRRLFEQTGDRWGIAVSLGALGYLVRVEGNYPRALKLTKGSLKAFRELGDQAGVAQSLLRLGGIAVRRGDYAEAEALHEESLALQRERGDQVGVASALVNLGLVNYYRGDYTRAQVVLTDALDLARAVAGGYLEPVAHAHLGWLAYGQGDFDAAARHWQTSLDQHLQAVDQNSHGYALIGLGLLALRQGDPALARRRIDEGLAVSRAAYDRRFITMGLHALGVLAVTQGDPARAAEWFGESLRQRKQMGDRPGVAEDFEGLAAALALESRPAEAARLWGAAQALRDQLGAPAPPVERDDYAASRAAARSALGDSFEAALAEGRAAGLEAALRWALAEASDDG